MKYHGVRLIIFILLLTGCSMNLPKNKRSLVQMNSNVVLNEDNLAVFLDKLYALKSNQKTDTLPLKILHIGDSHVLMGHFSNAVREGLQEEFGGSELGFFFPYILSGGYNPAGINIRTDSKWKFATNSKPDSTIQVGVTGATAQTIDSISSMIFAFKGRAKIKTVTIYHQPLDHQFEIRCDGAAISTIDNNNNQTAFTTITIPEEDSEIKVEIVKLNPGEHHLSIYGVSMNQLKSEGIDYHAFGVSGNQYQYFKNLNPIFKSQLIDFKPDLMIISLGSNDAYRKGIDSSEYLALIVGLIESIREIAPQTAFILTSPPDTKYKDESPVSENTVLNSIREACKITQSSQWDFHTLMGGTGSNQIWQKLNLATDDGLHLSNQGYQIEGALFNIALAKALKQKHPESTWLEKSTETYNMQVLKVL